MTALEYAQNGLNSAKETLKLAAERANIAEAVFRTAKNDEARAKEDVAALELLVSIAKEKK